MNPSTRIPDIVDEQDAAASLEQAEEIVAPSAASKHPSCHFHAQAMAGEIVDYLAAVEERMGRLGMPSASHLARLHDYALQLRCHHLRQLATINIGEAESPGQWRVSPGSTFLLITGDSEDPWELKEITVIEVLPADQVRVVLTEALIADTLSSITSPKRRIAPRNVPVRALF